MIDAFGAAWERADATPSSDRIPGRRRAYGLEAALAASEQLDDLIAAWRSIDPQDHGAMRVYSSRLVDLLESLADE
jgi:hypothetical protein